MKARSLTVLLILVALTTANATPMVLSHHGLGILLQATATILMLPGPTEAVALNSDHVKQLVASATEVKSDLSSQ